MKQFFFITCTIMMLYLPLVTTAADYTPLVGVPGVETSTDFNGYINSLYALSISIAALLAVIKIVIAGVKWMMTDIVTSKGEAKKDIQGAIVGLMVVLAAVLILYVINPNLVKIDLTLTKPGTVVNTSTPAAATLTAPIKSFSAGTASITYPDTTDATQVQLFSNGCTGTSYLFLGTSRCVTAATGDAVTVQTNCVPTVDCGIPCKAAGGTHYLDPVDSRIGYCVSKKE